MAILASSKRTEIIVPAIIPPITAVSRDVGMYMLYVGPQQSGTIQINAGGDITCKHGATGAEVVDTGIGASGVLDLSTPAAGLLSMGLLVDAINATANWKAILWGNLRADLTDGRFLDTVFMVNGVATTVTTDNPVQAKAVPVGILNDTTVVGATTTYIQGVSVCRENLLGRTDAGWVNAITSIDGIYTDAGVVAILTVTSINTLTKAETQVWKNVTALASATQFTFDQTDWGELPLYSFAGEHLLVQLRAPTTTFTSPTLSIRGFHQMVGGSSPLRSAPMSGQ
jgi:hypothetical protein